MNTAASTTDTPAVFGQDGLQEQEREGFQARVNALLPSPLEAALTHLRRRSDRMRIQTLAGHRVGHIRRAFDILRPLVPPRVLAAVFRATFDGFITARRFQGRGNCIFGCTQSWDCIKHYAVCAKFHRLCHQHLRLSIPPQVL